MEIVDLIKESYGGQSRVRKNISDYILANPLQSCFFSLKEFAEALNITEATVISYGKSIGFGSYLEMKKALQNYSMAEFSSQERLSLLASQSASFDGLFKRVERSEIGLLRSMFEHNPPEHIRKIIERIKQAACVFTAGHNVARMFADYFSWRLNSLGIVSDSLDLNNITLCLDKISSEVPSKNLLIVMTMTPYGKPTLALAGVCKKIGTPVIAVTDSEYSPVVKSADETLLVQTELLGLTNSPTAMFSLVNLITILIQFELQQDGRQPIEKRSDSLKDLYTDLLSDIS